MQFPAWTLSTLPILLGLVSAAAGLLAAFRFSRVRSRERARELERIVVAVSRREDPPGRQIPPIDSTKPRFGPWRRDPRPRREPAWVSTSDSTVRDTRDPFPTLISIPCLDSYSEEELKIAGESLGRRHATIWQMADSGQSAEAISTKTGQPIGEIELILALKRRIQAISSELPKGPLP